MFTKSRISKLRHEAFCFYYEDNLSILCENGTDIIFFSPQQAKDLPENIQGLYFGGGFPEIYAAQLAKNQSLLAGLRRVHAAGMPIYAECGGLMYLCRSINWRGQGGEMVGVIPADVEIRPRPQGHGYVEVEVTGENPLLPVGLKFWGHEFHHSVLTGFAGFKNIYRLARGKGIGNAMDGIVYKNVLAAYTHLHALGVPQWVDGFIALARKYRLNESARFERQAVGNKQ